MRFRIIFPSALVLGFAAFAVASVWGSEFIGATGSPAAVHIALELGWFAGGCLALLLAFGLAARVRAIGRAHPRTAEAIRLTDRV